MPGSSNFLRHNPPATNQEDDATFNGDATRTGGLVTNQIVPSVWLNKVLYQGSIFVAALAQALADKGFSPNDGSAVPGTAFNNLKTVLSNILTTADSPVVKFFMADVSSTRVSVAIPANTLKHGSMIQIVADAQFITSGAGGSAPFTFDIDFGPVCTLSYTVGGGSSLFTGIIISIRFVLVSGNLTATIFVNPASPPPQSISTGSIIGLDPTIIHSVGAKGTSLSGRASGSTLVAVLVYP